jgi:hypothetical protein
MTKIALWPHFQAVLCMKLARGLKKRSLGPSSPYKHAARPLFGPSFSTPFSTQLNIDGVLLTFWTVVSKWHKKGPQKGPPDPSGRVRTRNTPFWTIFGSFWGPFYPLVQCKSGHFGVSKNCRFWDPF